MLAWKVNVVSGILDDFGVSCSTCGFILDVSDSAGWLSETLVLIDTGRSVGLFAGDERFEGVSVAVRPGTEEASGLTTAVSWQASDSADAGCGSLTGMRFGCGKLTFVSCKFLRDEKSAHLVKAKRWTRPSSCITPSSVRTLCINSSRTFHILFARPTATSSITGVISFAGSVINHCTR